MTLRVAIWSVQELSFLKLACSSRAALSRVPCDSRIYFAGDKQDGNSSQLLTMTQVPCSGNFTSSPSLHSDEFPLFCLWSWSTSFPLSFKASVGVLLASAAFPLFRLPSALCISVLVIPPVLLSSKGIYCKAIENTLCSALYSTRLPDAPYQSFRSLRSILNIIHRASDISCFHLSNRISRLII